MNDKNGTQPLYKYNLRSIGDIIFCRGAAKSSKWNTFAQRVVRLNETTRYSHVALGMGGFVLHSMPGRGVHASSTLALLREQNDFCVFRHKSRDIPNTDDNVIAGAKEFVPRAQYFIGQRYNKRFLFPKSSRAIGRVDDNVFCSELICYLYSKELTRSFGRKRATSTLPLDIYLWIRKSSDWIDVTQIYKQKIQDCSLLGITEKWIEREQNEAHIFETNTLLIARTMEVEILAGRYLKTDFSALENMKSFNWLVAKAHVMRRRYPKRLPRK